ncbi:MAG: hydantoinase/oxoprolinase family protein [Anaerolineaceae bacterium]|nr:MAG: hydantoinase/oxoprolinase family protein [Anaerolineaceae bacterium]
MLIGVDIGGTFTDLVRVEDGELVIHKLPSTPRNPAAALLEGVRRLAGDRPLERVAHGSTVATNAILERKGAKTAFITTQGFRDLLFIGRQNRPSLYALHPQLPPPLIPRRLCYEVPERLDHRGDVLTALDVAVLDAVLDDIQAQGVESLAVCLLYSYVNPTHERLIQARAIERGLFAPEQVALSCDVLPEFREYERASTVALEAYVRPVMARYVAQIQAELPAHSGLRIMKSDGGVVSAGRVAQQAVQTALSGPAAGVIGAYHVAQTAGFEAVITLDMGGTSTDVAVCPGEIIRSPQSQIDGLPLRIRLLDIETVGAGGGSIARIDAGGALRVGPQSAGAEPGPAAYGRGGTLATVSDANAVLGRLDSANFLGGAMPLDMDAAHSVMDALAAQIGFDRVQAAHGVLDVANANIERAVRRVTVARGYDPRDFTLVAFGGAGGLHAPDVAARLGIERVFVPRYPGVLCAYGLLMADVVIDYSQSVLQSVTGDTLSQLADLLQDMLQQAQADLIAEGINTREARDYHPSLDARYQGQAHELNIAFDGTTRIEEAFHAAHRRAYGHALDRPVEVVNLRVQAIGHIERPHSPPVAESPTPRDAYLGDKTAPDGTRYALLQRERLTPGTRFEGAALVLQMDSTVYVPAGWMARVDAWHNLILEAAATR